MSRILSEIQRYVILRQKPLPREDPALLQLQSKLRASPRDPEALKQWGAHIHEKRHRDVLRRLRRFRKSATTATGVFFRELCDWLTRPFERSVVSPDPQSALDKLPNFAGNPEWDPAAASTLLAETFQESPQICSDPPTWHEFLQSVKVPKKQSAGMDCVPPHLISYLPETAQWILYRHVKVVWELGSVSTSWTDTRVSLLYIKGDPGDAGNCRPIAVSSCMYQILCKLMLRRLKAPLTGVLSPCQGGGRKGYTTITQAMTLGSSVLQCDGEPYVVLLDIAKAYPSIPHALLWETMYTLGVPASMVSLLRQAYGQTRCFFRAGGRQHSYFQQRGVKEGCPLSPLMFCVVYEIFHRALNKEFPKMKFFVYMDDVRS